jgi:hypothetical protein
MSSHGPVWPLACPARFERATYASEEFVAAQMATCIWTGLPLKIRRRHHRITVVARDSGRWPLNHRQSCRIVMPP